MLPHTSGGNSPLSGFVESFLNGVFVDPAEIGPEFLKINGLSFDSMFVLSNVGVARKMNEGLPLKLPSLSILGSCAPCWEGSEAQVRSPAVVGWV